MHGGNDLHCIGAMCGRKATVRGLAGVTLALISSWRSNSSACWSSASSIALTSLLAGWRGILHTPAGIPPLERGLGTRNPCLEQDPVSVADDLLHLLSLLQLGPVLFIDRLLCEVVEMHEGSGMMLPDPAMTPFMPAIMPGMMMSAKPLQTWNPGLVMAAATREALPMEAQVSLVPQMLGCWAISMSWSESRSTPPTQAGKLYTITGMGDWSATVVKNCLTQNGPWPWRLQSSRAGSRWLHPHPLGPHRDSWQPSP